MFSKFGIKEIFYGVKKYFVLILAATLLLGIFGFVTAKPAQIPNDYYLFSSSRSYLIDIKEDSSEEGTLRRTVMNNIYSSLSADFTKQYIFDNLIKEFSPEELLSATNSTLNQTDINLSILNGKINAALLNDSNIINFYSAVLDKEIAERITFYADEYFNNELISKFENIEGVTCLGGTDILTPNAESPAKSPVSAPKKAVIFAIIGFALSFIAVLAVVLIKPTVSRKGDYEDYGMKIVFDASSFKTSFEDYGAQALACATDKKELYILNLTNQKASINTLNKITQKLKENNDVSATVISDILNNFDAFMEVKKNGSIILADRIGATYHKHLKNTVSLLEQNQIEITGVVLI